MQILRLFQIDLFIVYKGYLSIQNIIKHFYLAYFEQKEKMKRLQFLRKTMD